MTIPLKDKIQLLKKKRKSRQRRRIISVVTLVVMILFFLEKCDLDEEKLAIIPKAIPAAVQKEPDEKSDIEVENPVKKTKKLKKQAEINKINLDYIPRNQYQQGLKELPAWFRVFQKQVFTRLRDENCMKAGHGVVGLQWIFSFNRDTQLPADSFFEKMGGGSTSTELEQCLSKALLGKPYSIPKGLLSKRNPLEKVSLNIFL